MGHARKERVVLFGTDQQITSGPAAMAAASRRRQSSKRKQAGYMTAPERFADTSDSSCTVAMRCGATSGRVLEMLRTLGAASPDCRPCRVGPGNFTLSPSQIRT
jgi:hypothetical protein